MPAQPTRRKIEPGIFERIGADGERRGLEIYFKDAGGSPAGARSKAALPKPATRWPKLGPAA